MTLLKRFSARSVKVDDGAVAHAATEHLRTDRFDDARTAVTHDRRLVGEDFIQLLLVVEDRLLIRQDRRLIRRDLVELRLVRLDRPLIG